MRQNRPPRLLSLALALAMTVSLAVTGAAAAEAPRSAWSSNFFAGNQYNYFIRNHDGTLSREGNYSPITRSFLSANADGTYTRVECYPYPCTYNGRSGDMDRITVEEYDASFHLTARHPLPLELPRFLGCLIAEDGIYIATATTYNWDELPTAEVMRVVRYSRDCQQRLAAKSIVSFETDANFIGIGSNSNFSMILDQEGRLIIHTSSLHPKTSDGMNHQSNVTFDLDGKDLSFHHYPGAGYVSHSFAQFVRDDRDFLVFADHGDAHPRSVVINQISKDYRQEYVLNGRVDRTSDALPISGESGDNFTGVTLGGLEVSSSSYLTIGTTVDQTQFAKAKERMLPGNRLFVTVTDKTTMESQVKYLEQLPDEGPEYLTVPQLVVLGGDRFLALWGTWNDSGAYTTKCALLDGKGTLTGQIQTIPAPLSDCQPVVRDGVVTWYVTKDSNAPIFYQLDPKTLALTCKDTGRPYLSGVPAMTGDQSNFGYDTALTGTFADVPAGSWYADTVKSACQLGLMKGTSGDAFQPDGTLTLGETAALAARIHSIYTTGKAAFTQGNPWYQVYVDYCKQSGILTWDLGDMTAQATRAQFVQLLEAAIPGNVLPTRYLVNIGAVPDVSVDAPYAQAVYRFYRAGITGGDANGNFMPDKTITRAEVATIVSRVADPNLTRYMDVTLEQFPPYVEEIFPFTWPEVQGWYPVDQPPDDPNKDPSGSDIGQLEHEGIQRELLPAGVERPADYQYDESVLPEGNASGELTCETIERRSQSYDGQHFTEYVDLPNPLYDSAAGRRYMQATYTFYAPARNHWAQLSHPEGDTAGNPRMLSFDAEFVARIGTDSFIKLDAYYSDGEGDVHTTRWANACCGLLNISGISVVQGEDGGGQVTGLTPSAWYCVTKLHWLSPSSFTPVSAFYQADGNGVIQIDNTVDDDIYLQLLDAEGVTAPTLVR